MISSSIRARTGSVLPTGRLTRLRPEGCAPAPEALRGTGGEERRPRAPGAALAACVLKVARRLSAIGAGEGAAQPAGLGLRALAGGPPGAPGPPPAHPS